MKKRVFAVVLLCAVLIMSCPFYARADSDFDRAIELYGKGKFEETIDILTVYVESKPEPAAYWLIGYSLYKLERFDEADKYFQDAYLIDPDFSPKQIEAFAPGLEELDKEMQMKLGGFEREITVPEEKGLPMPTFELTPEMEGVEAEPQIEGEQPAGLQQEPAEPAVEQPVAPAVVPPAPAVQPMVEKPAAPAVQPKVEKPAPPPVSQPVPPPVQQPIQPKPRRQVRPPITPPQFPGGAGGMGSVATIMAMLAGFMMVIIIVQAVLYIYQSLCIFLIARKLNVSAAWTAWIPIIQIWPIVGSAGKPWPWILILFSPFLAIPFSLVSNTVYVIASFVLGLVSLIVFIYLWMLISENLGKSKWLGFLMWIPGVFLLLPTLIIMGYFAFSKTGGASSRTEEEDFGGGDFGGGDFDIGGSDQDLEF